MPIIVNTSINSGKSSFRSEKHTVDESDKQYRFVNNASRRHLNKSNMMKPDSMMLATAMPVAANIWHLPEQEAEAKALLVAFCRERIKAAREEAASIYAVVEASEAFLNSLEV